MFISNNIQDNAYKDNINNHYILFITPSINISKRLVDKTYQTKIKYVNLHNDKACTIFYIENIINKSI